MKKHLALLPFVVVLALSLAVSGAAPEPLKLPGLKTPDLSKLTAWPVVRVLDGDTIVVGVRGRDTRVRLIGVDTPERAQEYHREANRFTTNLLKGEWVHLFADPRGDKRDGYRRTLAYVYRAPDGLFVNAELIRQGYGRAYTHFHFKYRAQFRQLERFARQAQKGLWAERAEAPRKPTILPPVAMLPVATPPPKPDGADAIVYVTKTGRKYHRADCRYLRTGGIPITLKNAKAQGYAPCKVCKPPQ